MTDPRKIRFIVVLAILNSALLAIFSYTGAFSVFLHLSTIPLSFLVVVIIEKLGSFLGGSVLSGWTPGLQDPRDQFAADMEKIRECKRTSHFPEALRLANNILRQDPEFPDALYLKATILWEGFGNAEGAKGCLKKIKEKVPNNETLCGWASSYYDEVMEAANTKKKTQ
jgi:tetratricopeptide (TPR) repeat protein